MGGVNRDELVPEPSAATARYWEAANEGRLELPRCRDCDEWVFYPREWCPQCHGTDLEWTEASGDGVVYTFTVLHSTPVGAYVEAVPYVLAVVELVEGPRMMANVVGCDPTDVEVGSEVSVTFERREGQALPQFELS